MQQKVTINGREYTGVIEQHSINPSADETTHLAFWFEPCADLSALLCARLITDIFEISYICNNVEYKYTCSEPCITCSDNVEDADYYNFCFEVLSYSVTKIKKDKNWYEALDCTADKGIICWVKNNSYSLDNSRSLVLITEYSEETTYKYIDKDLNSYKFAVPLEESELAHFLNNIPKKETE